MISNIIYEPKVEILDSRCAPDSWDSSHGLIPPDDFIVSRNRDGSVASRYGDKSWDRTPYQRNGRSAWLHFSYWGAGQGSSEQEALAYEIRFLMFILIWKRQGSPLSNSTLDNYIIAFRRVAQYAESKACSIRDVLTSTNLLAEYVRSDVAIGLLASLKTMLKTLLKLGVTEVGFDVLGLNAEKLFEKKITRYKNGVKQYAPIPTRIYSIIISELSDELSEWEAVADRYFALIQECLADPLIGKYKTVQIGLSKKHGIERTPGEYKADFNDLLKKYDLLDYFNAKGLTHSTFGLTRGLTYVMTAAKLYIVTFSGMRNDEATNLLFQCLETEFSTDGKTHYIIAGRTTKLKDIRTKWVTNTEGARAIKLAQRISEKIYAHLKERPASKSVKINKYPLFISPSYLGFVGQLPKGDKDTWHPVSFGFFKKSYDDFRGRFQPIIEEADLQELEDVDPHRAWRAEVDFQVNSPWRLTDHQLRRSLALYAQRSGLVSLPTLRRQLQHITDEMSRYYSRGSLFATNFIGDNDEHFGWEWQDATPVSAGLAYIRDVLFSKEPAFGGYKKWMENQLGTPAGQILLDRDVTMKRFRNGELAYKETPLGGCTKVGPCEEVAIRFLDVDCLAGCPNLVGNLSKLERVIKAQSTLVNRLDTNTIEGRIEMADLEVLIETRDRITTQPKENLQ